MNSITEIVSPARIVLEHKTENAEALIKEKPLQISLTEPDLTLIRQGGYIVLDYGVELAGGVRLLAYKGSKKVRLRLGESVSEACSEITGGTATNDHAVRDGVFCVPDFSDQSYFNSGFRFLRIDCLEGEISLKSAVAEYTHFAGEQLGSFECDRPLLNEIFSTAARTVMLNLQNGYIWDGIKRDRLVWIGDIHPEMLAATHVFGKLENIERALDFVRDGTPLPKWMNDFPTYSMWWLLILKDYYMLTGERDFVLSSVNYVMELSEQINKLITDDGELKLDFIFLDWPTHDKPDEAPGVHALALLAMQAAISLCADFGVENVAAAHTEEKLKRYAVRAEKSKQAIAMQLLAGYDCAVEKLLEGGSAGMSTFMSYYILRAVHKSGYGKQALSMLEEYYGGMLSLGATSFWEDFDICWLNNAAPITRLPEEGEVDVHASFGAYCYVGFRHSLCHGWSSGPVPYLFRLVLGFEPLDAGCKRVRIKPDLCGLKYVNAKIPVPGGVIEVKAREGKKPEIKAPEGIKVITD